MKPQSKGQAIGFVAAGLFEVLINCACALLVVASVWYVVEYGVFAVAVSLVLALYASSLLTLGLLGVAFRIAPKPVEGRPRSKAQRTGIFFCLALSNFQTRSLARLTLIAPFPATHFYRLCGSSIEGMIQHPHFDAIHDPWGLVVGRNVVIGDGAKVFAHVASEAGKILVGRVVIGSSVLIGARAVIAPGVVIGDGARINIGARVSPWSVIGAGEVWDGAPARCIDRKR
ncbi:MAG: acyltransferase [Casimicrobium sp.]